MIGLLSSPGAVLAADEAAARRAAAPIAEDRPDATPVDAVHAVEAANESAQAAARHHDTQELTTDERLRQDEALHAEPDHEDAERTRELQARDAEVRQHEQAHMAAGGGLTGPASYRYERGSDGRQYAVEGEVSIDTASEPDPDATIAKMRQVRRAALAPHDPSSQDHSVATKAAQVIRAAEAELAARRQETLRQAADELAQARDAAIVDARERANDDAIGPDAAPPPAAHRVSEYQRQAVLSAGSRLSSIPPAPSTLDESI